MATAVLCGLAGAPPSSSSSSPRVRRFWSAGLSRPVVGWDGFLLRD